MPGAKDPGTVKMDALYLRASNLGHGMEQVANYYRVDIRVSLMTPTLLYNDALLNSASLHETENTAIKLFGLRIRQAMTTQEGNAGPLLTEGDAAFRAEFEGLEANWLSLRIKQLKALHEDNVIWEDGTLQLAGDPGLAVGKYLELTRGNFVANYYINGVDHVYQPLRDWNTTVHVERGTGFLKRVQTGPAPIWQEGRPGAYGA
jgi:hypothetical protein